MEHAETIRVLVVDDHVIVRAGLRALLAEVSDMEVIGEAEDGAQATEMARDLEPDVILMDLVMPEIDGIEAIRQIMAEHPNARVLALTSFSADDKVFPALKAGALGYLLKDTEPRDLVCAIRQVYRGESSLHPSVARKVLQEFHSPQAAKKRPETLTERESEVLGQVAQGLTNQEIAEKLFVSEATVRTHVSNILAKLHMANRVQATLYALKTGIATLSDDD
jgi:NarL family two-component system response regulator LiaR